MWQCLASAFNGSAPTTDVVNHFFRLGTFHAQTCHVGCSTYIGDVAMGGVTGSSARSVTRLHGRRTAHLANNGTVWSMASAQGKVFAGGSFTQIRPPGTAEGDPASLNRAQLAVFDAATGAPITNCVIDLARGAATAIVRAVTTSPDKSVVYIGGLFDTVKGTARRNIAAIDVAECTVLPFNPQPSSFVYAIAATNDAVYFGGTFTTLGTATRSRLGAATPAGVVLPWAPTTDDEVLALATDPNNGNVIIGGRSGTINGQIRTRWASSTA